MPIISPRRLRPQTPSLHIRAVVPLDAPSPRSLREGFVAALKISIALALADGSIREEIAAEFWRALPARGRA